MNSPPDSNGVDDESFRRLAAFDPAAFGEIASRLWARLRPGTRRRLRRTPELAGHYDAEDAFQNAMSLMWLRILDGSMAPPGGVDDFLRLARTIIGRQITAKARAERAAKRNSTPFDEPAWSTGRLDRYVPDDVSVFPSGLRTPEAQAIAEDETRWLMRILGPALREVAEARLLGGLTIEEIARIRGVSPSTVSRMFQEIRAIWEDELRRNRE